MDSKLIIASRASQKRANEQSRWFYATHGKMKLLKT
jgi:hypothetical protein